MSEYLYRPPIQIPQVHIRNRSRTNSLNEDSKKGIVSIWTFQIYICVIVLILALILRFSGGSLFSNVKAYFSEIASYSIVLSDVKETFNSVFSQGEKIRQAMAEFIDKIPVTSDKNNNSSSSKSSSKQSSNGSSSGSSSGASSQELDSWKAESDTSPKEVSFKPSGGSDITTKTKDTGGLLMAPTGASFAPYIIIGEITSPLEKGTITSTFGFREHPITKKFGFHTGLDIGANEGSDVYTILPGQVLTVGENDIDGNFVIVRHSESLMSKYAHLSKVIAPVSAIIRRGERLGLVGTTGLSTGPHLHIEIIVNGLNVDPGLALKGSF